MTSPGSAPRSVWAGDDFELIDLGAATAPVEVIEVPVLDSLAGTELVGVSDQAPSGNEVLAGHATHRQELPQSVFTVVHYLGYYPAGVALFSLDMGVKYRAFGVQHLDENSLRISMDRPTPCVVVMS